MDVDRNCTLLEIFSEVRSDLIKMAGGAHP
jgi:hypothetical protein